MENSPLTALPNTEKSSTNDKDSESSSKSKKKIGKVAVEVQPKDKRAPREVSAGLFEKTKKSEKVVAEAPKIESAEQAAAILPELSEDASLERLDEAEQRLLERETVEQLRTESRQQEQSPHATAEELAADQAVEDFRDKITLEGKSSEQAAAEALSQIPAIAEALLPEIVDSQASELEPTETVIDTRTPNEGEVTLNTSRPENSAGVDEDPVADAINNSARPTSGGAGGSGLPPHLTGLPPFGPNGNFNAHQSPNIPKTESSQNQISAEAAYYYVREAENRGLLVGGVFGYLIGRRRGRIKAEKKLLPIQKKLEKEAKSLRGQVIDRENDIRQAAKRELQARDPEGSQTLRPRPTRERRQPVLPELRRMAAPDAERLHSKGMQPERIGHVLITAQTERGPQRTPLPEVVRPKPIEAIDTNKLSPEKQVETMTRNELLLLSEKIAVDGATLRQIYQTHLVGERGLRRVITEYLRGGDIKRQLRRELVEREIDFERDPILRDRARASISSDGGKGVLDNLLVKAGAVPTGAEVAEQLAVQKAQAAHEDAVATKHTQRRRVADISLVSTIVVLMLLVAMLLLTRH